MMRLYMQMLWVQGKGKMKGMIIRMQILMAVQIKALLGQHKVSFHLFGPPYPSLPLQLQIQLVLDLQQLGLQDR